MLIAALFLFRTPLSRLFQSESGLPQEQGLFPAAGSLEALRTPLPTGEIKVVPSPSPVVREEQDSPLPTPLPLPPYRGRDPAEFRPTDAEVASLSQEQKNKLSLDLRAYAKVVRERPDFLFEWVQIGAIKKVIGDYEGARDAWEYAGIARPGNAVSFANLGELYSRYLKDYPRAERNFRAALKNDPKDFQSYLSLSELYHYSYREKEDLADDVLLEGSAANPGNVDFFRTLANLYKLRQEYDKAVEWWEKVLAAEPGNSAVEEEIARLKQMMRQ